MKRLVVSAVCGLMTFCVYTHPVGLVVKGVTKAWNTVTKIALKVSGKSVSDDAVKMAAKTIEKASSKYGDDIAEAAMHGGVESAELSPQAGGKFVALLKRAGCFSDEAIRAVVQNEDDALKYMKKYGDDAVRLASKAPSVYTKGISLVERSGVCAKQVISALADLPAEQIPLVLKAVEKNPGVAKEFLVGVSRGGKYFVDKVFTLDAKQILAGTLEATVFAVAVRETAPPATEGEAISKGTDAAIELMKRKSGKPTTEEQKIFVKEFTEAMTRDRPPTGLL